MLFRSKPLQSSLRLRILVFFLLVSFVSILVLSVTFYFVSADIIKKNSEKLLIDLIDQIANEVNSLFVDAHRTLRMVANDPKIQQVLRNPYPSSISELYSIELEVDNQLSFVQSYVKDIFGIYIVGANGTQYKSNFFSGREGDWHDTWWYQEVSRSYDTFWLGPHNGAFIVETTDQPIITVGESIIDKASGDSLGIVLLDIEVKTLEELLEANLEGFGNILLADADRRVVCSIPQLILDPKRNQMFSPVSHEVTPINSEEYRTEGYLVYSSQIGMNNWLTIGMIPQSQLTKDMKSITTFIIVLIIAVCIIDALVALYFTGKVANPIKKLMMLMKQVETGDFDVNMEIASKDELGKLSESFNVMVKKLDNSMKMLFENQRKLRKAELRALEAQINPHFLYNTLDSVCWLARAERSDEIINTVVALTKLLRIGLSRGDEIITIGNEVEHVNNYLIIQKMRYRKKFDYIIDVPEEIKEYKILKLILQPLAENALYHGIKSKMEKGTIRISAGENSNTIAFSISDTGIGMSQKQIAVLEKSLEDKDSTKAEGIGLKNVNERMKIYFGEEYGLSFESEEGVGTTVNFKIPIIKGE